MSKPDLPTRRGEMPPEIAAHELVRLLAGLSLNGSPIGMFPKPWPDIIGAVDRATGDKAEAFAHELELRKYTEEEVREALGIVQRQNPVGPAPAAVYTGGITFLKRSQLNQLPPVEYVVDEIFQAKSHAILYGGSGVGKTLVTLSMALSVVTGRQWMGRDVVKGPVLYILGEGAEAVPSRIRAWEEAHNAGQQVGDDFVLVPMGIDLDEPNAAAELLWGLLSTIDQAPRMIVVDTLARNMQGDENSTQDAGRLNRAFDGMWRQTGAVVVVIQHTGRNDEMRGSIAFPSAASTIIRVRGAEESDELTVICEKQRNGKKFDTVSVIRTEVARSMTVTPSIHQQGVVMTDSQHDKIRVLTVLARETNKKGVSLIDLRSQLNVTPESLQRFYRTLDAAGKNGLTIQRMVGKTKLVSISPTGRDYLNYVTGGKNR